EGGNRLVHGRGPWQDRGAGESDDGGSRAGRALSDHLGDLLPRQSPRGPLVPDDLAARDRPPALHSGDVAGADHDREQPVRERTPSALLPGHDGPAAQDGNRRGLKTYFRGVSHLQVHSTSLPARSTTTLICRPKGTSCIQTRRRFIASWRGNRLPSNFTSTSPFWTPPFA